MLTLKSVVLTMILLLNAQVLAVPNPQTTPAVGNSSVPSTSSDYAPPPVLRCGIEGPDGNPLTCPPKYTCCGPLTVDQGGTCRLLKPDQFCIF